MKPGIKAIRFSYVGYKAIFKGVVPNQEQTIDVELVVEDQKK